MEIWESCILEITGAEYLCHSRMCPVGEHKCFVDKISKIKTGADLISLNEGDVLWIP